MKDSSRWAVGVGVVGSVISVFVFLTGIVSLPDFLGSLNQKTPRRDASVLPAPPVRRGVTLTIRSNVANTHTFVNGNHVGSTPVTVSLTAGLYQIKVEKQGCVSASRELSLSDGERGATELHLTCNEGGGSADPAPTVDPTGDSPQPPEYDPGRTSSLTLVSARLNGIFLDVHNPILAVPRGASIRGSVSLRADSSWHEAAIAFGMSPSWGDHAKAVVDLGGFYSPVHGLQRHVDLNLQAPETPGEYYIIFAYRGEFTAAQVFSATGWTTKTLIWDNGDDLADWSAAQIREAIRTGRVASKYVIPEGAVYVPATAVIVSVE